jgi:solute carrier family 35 protein F1/2
MSNAQIEAEAPYKVEDGKSSIESPSVPPLPNDQLIVRPPIDYSSFDAFCRSTWRRFQSLWTRRFILSLLAGQVVSLCITCTNVTTQELQNGDWALPTTQTFFLYPALFFSLTCPPDKIIVQLLLHFRSVYTLHNLPMYASPLDVGRFLTPCR